MAEPAIPVIDIEPYRAGDPAGAKRVADTVGAACERIGFLVIAGHGISDALVRRLFDVSLAFFDLPLAEKLTLRSDDPGIPRGYSALASKNLGRTYGLDTPPDLREQFFVGPLDDWAYPAGSSRSTPAGATSTGRSIASRPARRLMAFRTTGSSSRVVSQEHPARFVEVVTRPRQPHERAIQ
jgi:isopenicillin N synthase-like dioxygenase